jgi:L-histidine N-alpha-methyltransferase
MNLLEADAVVVESHLWEGAPRALADDVLDGLTRPFKELPPKHFYDPRGSKLFSRITELPEYYPTRCEREILATQGEDILTAADAAELVELGSGTADKTRALLDTGLISRYVPFDVSEATLVESAAALVEEYPGLTIHGVVGDFERHLPQIPDPVRGQPRLLAFLGGTIGNFTPGARRRFLRSLAERLGPDDALLLGTDLVKDPDIIEAAYNDSQGVTAEFNRNVLRVINRELGADFPVERFEHVAFFDPVHEWIEMRLRAPRACRVRIPALDLSVDFGRGEEVRTEISAKFTPQRVRADLSAAGLGLVDWFTDSRGYFALSLSRPLR